MKLLLSTICLIQNIFSQQYFDSHALQITKQCDAHVWDHITSYLPGRHLFLIQRLSSKRPLIPEHIERMIPKYAKCYIAAIKKRVFHYVHASWLQRLIKGSKLLNHAAQLTTQPLLIRSLKPVKIYLTDYLLRQIDKPYGWDRTYGPTVQRFYYRSYTNNFTRALYHEFIPEKLPTSELAGLLALEGWHHYISNLAQYLDIPEIKILLPYIAHKADDDVNTYYLSFLEETNSENHDVIIRQYPFEQVARHGEP